MRMLVLEWNILRLIVWCLITAVIPCLGVLLYLWYSTKRAVKQIPKTPMLLCDQHGPFPASTALNVNVDGSARGVVDLCPYCVLDRVSKPRVN